MIELQKASNGIAFLSNQRSGSSENSDEKVELLVNTREKRSTAGNRLHNLLRQEEPDDELELLFAEDDEDVDYANAEGDESDIQMGSSDNEDQGPEEEDDFQGEKDIEKLDRMERAKVIKKNRGIFNVFQKKVRADNDLAPSTPKPKKKYERASWLSTSCHTPVRASARGSTRQSKQELQVQIMDREIKRLKQAAKMEKIAAEKAKKKNPPLTQEDRLKEAAKVEIANTKCLTRWERAEQERENERTQRLANLHDRKIEGPVITYWSGVATYVNGKLTRLGKIDIDNQSPLTAKKRNVEVCKNYENTQSKKQKTHSELRPKNKYLKSLVPENKEINVPKPLVPDISQIVFEQSHQTSSFLAPTLGLNLIAPPPHPFLAPPPLGGPSPHSGLGFYAHQLHQYRHYMFNKSSTHKLSAKVSIQTPMLLSSQSPSPIEHCLRSSLIFSNFSEAAIKSREAQLKAMFPYIKISAMRISKPPRSKTGTRSNLCVITGYPAKYKDPKTGLQYYNSYAYKELQKLQKGEIRWSDLLGAYAGSNTMKAARGVPDRFMEIVQQDSVAS